MSIQTSQNERPAEHQVRLQIQMLGTPAIIWQDRPLDIPRRTVRALFFRLACTNSPVSRQHLTLIFWPDSREKTARRNLSHHLTHLRRALPIPEALVSSGDRLWLDPELIQCDVLRFKNAVKNAQHETVYLRPAADLYQGPFLDGFDLPGSAEFEHWMTLERSSLERLYLEALAELIDLCTEDGENSTAIRYAQRYLESDDLSEEMHQRLIKLYALSGDRSAAIQQYERCQSILSRELDVSPLPETQAVYQAVLVGQISFPEPSAPVSAPELPGMDVPLIGRAQTFHLLEEAYYACLTGRGQVALISGEMGIGKSRLVRDFARQYRDQARVLFASAHAGEQSIPYQPILEAMRTIAGLESEGPLLWKSTTGKDSVPALTTYLEPLWVTEISRLLPELRSLYPDLPSPLLLEPESAQARLFEAVSRLFLTFASKHGPVILCLDDLHWADSSTQAWLVHLVRLLQRGRYRMLILGTYRSVEMEAVNDLRHNLTRLGGLREIMLPGLDDSAVLEILQHLVGQRPGLETLAGHLHRASGGNPFYLIETMRALSEEGQFNEDLLDLANLPLPASVRQAIQLRLERMSPKALQVIEAGAVLGLTFPYELVRLTSGRNEADLVAGLEEAAHRQLLVETGNRYAFIHQLTRRVVLETLSYARKRLLNLRAGKAYEQLQPDALAQLAHHFESGEEWTKALHYHGLASHQAESMFAWQEAEYHQGCMLAMLKKIDPSSERPDAIRQRGQVLADRAQTRYLQGRLAERDADLEALDALGETSGNEDVRLQAIIQRVRFLNMDGEYTQSISTAEKGLALIDASPGLSAKADSNKQRRAQILAQIGFANYFMGQPREALNALNQAQALGLDKDDPESCGRILNILGYVYFHLGDFTRSLECQQQAYACHQQVGNYQRVARDLIDIGAVYKNLGNMEEARHYLHQGLELARRIKTRPAESYGLTHLGSWELYEGDYSAAATHYQQALELEQDLHSEHMIATSEAGVGLALYHLGNYPESRSWLEHATQRARAIGHRRRLAETLIELGLVDLVEKRLSDARQKFIEGLTLARDSQSIESLAAGLAALARLERLSGNPSSALTLAEEAEDAARQNDLTGCEMWAQVELALASLAIGQPVEALKHSRRAISLVSEASQDWLGMEQAYFSHAQIQRALGHDTEASETEQMAWRIIHEKAEKISDPEQRQRFLDSNQDNM